MSDNKVVFKVKEDRVLMFPGEADLANEGNAVVLPLETQLKSLGDGKVQLTCIVDAESAVVSTDTDTMMAVGSVAGVTTTFQALTLQ